VTVIVGETPPENPPAELTHSDAEAVAEIAQDAASELVEPILDIAISADVKAHKNESELEELKTWQATTNQTLETLTVGVSQMSETMLQILNLLQASAEPQEQSTPQASPNADADDPANPTLETPAQQEAPDNRKEKRKAQRTKSWM
jgi:hypothetical protein